MLVSCEGADLRPLPMGVMLYCDFDQQFDTLPTPEIARVEMIDELNDVVMHSRAPVRSGESALATMEFYLAILQSSREQKEILLVHQTGLPEFSESWRNL